MGLLFCSSFQRLYLQSCQPELYLRMRYYVPKPQHTQMKAFFGLLVDGLVARFQLMTMRQSTSRSDDQWSELEC